MMANISYDFRGRTVIVTADESAYITGALLAVDGRASL
jgi:hypothetical protein